ncbi:DUF7002 family protein [Geodermatophilus africanus]|uniref:DUF7002 family protein n=1 Tax=Geodermatophilus africanus TaxID=1137993 RepID=UPI003CC7AFCF
MWPCIERHGLLSAAEIVRRWQVPPDRAEALLTRKRPEPVLLDHPELGVAVRRDQHPLREHLLAPALTDGMNVEDWLRLLNGFVFFFYQLRPPASTALGLPHHPRRSSEWETQHVFAAAPFRSAARPRAGGAAPRRPDTPSARRSGRP